MKKGKYYIVCMLIGVLFFFVGCQEENRFVTKESDADVMEHDLPSDLEQTEVSDASEKQDEAFIYVYVCGHVVHPGVYAVLSEARICDALALAGGVTEDGVEEALQQAEKMQDGQTLYVPGRDEVDQEQHFEKQDEAEDGLVNINSASAEELKQLPGIGDSKANTIINYRNEHGGFQAIEDLMQIPGIKEGVYLKIKNMIKV
ncbi:MAG: helix-hairpin-helix domain-containing protein [Eubacteriales bacterium]|nr:helix-hairpin-helix domain-containing protein [Eubacteriales bacterium]